jgi:Na+-driven multidrug efflux pump
MQGTGRQMTGAKIYAFTHGFCGPILLWLFPFHFKWGVQGIWVTLAVISNVQVVFMTVRLFAWCMSVARYRYMYMFVHLPVLSHLESFCMVVSMFL